MLILKLMSNSKPTNHTMILRHVIRKLAKKCANI
jgi:hypothetical protein